MAATAESIEELYRARYVFFRDGVAAILGNREAAHDVVQDAFAQALHDRRQFRGEGSLAGWIWRITFRLALRTKANGRREMTLDELVDLTPLPLESRDPDLAEGLKRLSPQRRLIVFLHYFADLPYSEIASLLEISGGTVAATLTHARADLLRHLEREEAHR